MKGCFNAFSGQCTGCGRPRSCPDYNNADLTDPMGFPYFYTGSSAFCSHCPDSLAGLLGRRLRRRPRALHLRHRPHRVRALHAALLRVQGMRRQRGPADAVPPPRAGLQQLPDRLLPHEGVPRSRQHPPVRECGQAAYDACSEIWKSEACESCCADPAEATFIKDPEP